MGIHDGTGDKTMLIVEGLLEVVFYIYIYNISLKWIALRGLVSCGRGDEVMFWDRFFIVFCFMSFLDGFKVGFGVVSKRLLT